MISRLTIPVLLLLALLGGQTGIALCALGIFLLFRESPSETPDQLSLLALYSLLTILFIAALHIPMALFSDQFSWKTLLEISAKWLVRYGAPGAAFLLGLTLAHNRTVETGGPVNYPTEVVISALIPAALFPGMLFAVLGSVGTGMNLLPRSLLPAPGANPIAALMLTGLFLCAILRPSDPWKAQDADAGPWIAAEQNRSPAKGLWPVMFTILMMLYASGLAILASRSALVSLLLWGGCFVVARFFGNFFPGSVPVRERLSKSLNLPLILLLILLLLIPIWYRNGLVKADYPHPVYQAIQKPSGSGADVSEGLGCGVIVKDWRGFLLVNGRRTPIVPGQTIEAPGRANIQIEIEFDSPVEVAGISYQLSRATGRDRVLVEGESSEIIADFHGCSGRGAGGEMKLIFPPQAARKMNLSFTPVYRTDYFSLERFNIHRPIGEEMGSASVFLMNRPPSGLADSLLGRFRAQIWRCVERISSEVPWAGFGPGRAATVFQRMADLYLSEGMVPPRHAHNMIVQLYLETGWAGAFAGVVFALVLMIHAVRFWLIGRPEAAGIVCVFLGFNAADCVICSSATACFLFYTLALALRISRE